MVTTYEFDSIINLYSECNENMEIIIIPMYPEACSEIMDIAEKAYDYWMGDDECVDEIDKEYDTKDSLPIGDFVVEKLKQYNYMIGRDYKMYFDAQWND